MADIKPLDDDKMAVTLDNQTTKQSVRENVTQEESEQRSQALATRPVLDNLPKKKSGFKITSVTNFTKKGGSSEFVTDADGDSLDDLDESRTEDVSSEIFDSSKATDVDQDPTSGNLTPEETVGKDKTVDIGMGMAGALQSTRFKVVKIESKEPYRRGRWLCLDFLEKEKEAKVPIDESQSGHSSAANSVHFVPAIDDTSKSPLVTNTLPTSQTVVAGNSNVVGGHVNVQNDINVPFTLLSQSGVQQNRDFQPIHPASQLQNVLNQGATAGHSVLPQTQAVPGQTTVHPVSPSAQMASSQVPIISQREQLQSKQHPTNIAQQHQIKQVPQITPNLSHIPQPINNATAQQIGIQPQPLPQQIPTSVPIRQLPQQIPHNGQPPILQPVAQTAPVSQSVLPQLPVHTASSINTPAVSVASLPQHIPVSASAAQPLINVVSSAHMTDTNVSGGLINVPTASLQGPNPSAMQSNAGPPVLTSTAQNVNRDMTANTALLTNNYSSVSNVPACSLPNYQATVVTTISLASSDSVSDVHTSMSTMPNMPSVIGVKQHVVGQPQTLSQQQPVVPAQNQPVSNSHNSTLQTASISAVANEQQHSMPNGTFDASTLNASKQNEINTHIIESNSGLENVSVPSSGNAAALGVGSNSSKTGNQTQLAHSMERLTLSAALANHIDSARGTSTSDSKSKHENIHIVEPICDNVGSSSGNAGRILSDVSNVVPLLSPLAAAVGGLSSPTREEKDESGSSTIAIDNKIEQAMDLVKSHLMFAVREEVEVLKEQIKGLVEKISQLEYENGILRTAASQETLAKLAQPRPQPPSSSS